MASFIYDRLRGTPPDFTTYAEHDAAYTQATVFNREKIRAAEMAALDHKY